MGLDEPIGHVGPFQTEGFAESSQRMLLRFVLTSGAIEIDSELDREVLVALYLWLRRSIRPYDLQRRHSAYFCHSFCIILTSDHEAEHGTSVLQKAKSERNYADDFSEICRSRQSATGCSA